MDKMTQSQGNQQGQEVLNPPYSCLPLSWSVTIIFACCMVAFNLQSSPIHFLPKLTDSRFWPQTWDGWLERSIMIVLTFYLMLNQTDYYYGWLNWSSKSGIFKSIGWTNIWEVVTDFALGFWGACLLSISFMWPGAWIPDACWTTTCTAHCQSKGFSSGTVKNSLKNCVCT